jgi:hypothetical protein
MRYEKLRSKYKNLPSLSWIKENFDSDSDKVKDICRDIASSLRKVEDYIESLILAESFDSYVERGFLSKKEKDRIAEIYKKIRALLVLNLRNIIEKDEEKIAEWICSCKELWEEIRRELPPILEKIASGWRKKKIKMERDDTSRYFF